MARTEDGTPLGYGYVQYEKPESAEAAVEKANGMLLEGKQLYVAHYTNKEQRGGIKGFTNLYVKNLPSGIDTDDKLVELFKEFGDITSAWLAKAGQVRENFCQEKPPEVTHGPSNSGFEAQCSFVWRRGCALKRVSWLTVQEGTATNGTQLLAIGTLHFCVH